MLSTPVPARPITRRAVAFSIRSAVTLVLLRTINASYPPMIAASSLALIEGCSSTVTPLASRSLSTPACSSPSQTRIRIRISKLGFRISDCELYPVAIQASTGEGDVRSPAFRRKFVISAIQTTNFRLKAGLRTFTRFLILACCQQAVLCVPGVLRGFSCSVARDQPQRTPSTQRRNANVSEQHTITPLPDVDTTLNGPLYSWTFVRSDFLGGAN